MRVADGVVGQLQVLERVHLTAGPDAAIAVLVAGEILEDRLHLRAVRVSGIGTGTICPPTAKWPSGLGPRSNMKPSKFEWAVLPLNSRTLRSTRPGLRTDLRAFELTRRMLRQGEPETCRVGPRGHVVPVDIVRIGDPESRRRVVGRDQDILGVLAGRIEVRAVRRSERGEVCRDARRVRMALGQDPQVVDELVAVLHGVFEEEAVTNVVVGHVVFNVQVICAMHGHAAAVGVVNRGVLDVLPLRIADQMPVDRIPGQMHVLTHAIELDALDKHLAPAHRHDVAAKERLCLRQAKPGSRYCATACRLRRVHPRRR